MQIKTTVTLDVTPNNSGWAEAEDFQQMPENEVRNKVTNRLSYILSEYGKKEGLLSKDDPMSIESVEVEPASAPTADTVNVTLNSFDCEGNQVDTDNMDITKSQVSDIIDHSAQLAVVMRDMAAGRCGIEAFDQVFSELDEALNSAGVVTDDVNPIATLLLAGEAK